MGKRNEALDNILGRRSIREFSGRPVPDEAVRWILQAGMSGPSCVNARDWSFVVVKQKDVLEKMAEANGRPAAPARNAAFAILVCGDLTRFFPPAKDYWVIDGAIAGQNMVLAARALGVGSVWLGTWPEMDRVENQETLFGLPKDVVPHSLIAFGYPKDPESFDAPFKPVEEGRVHFEKW